MSFTGKQLQILTTSEKLFAQNDFDGTSIRDIAQEAAAIGASVTLMTRVNGP
ncbi:MAG TPA: TetR family transcriptional regulator [Chitinophagaceae bacterium]|nr:TetR family transcriptional regulator [Chitinophagaceae bacterium]